LAKAEVKHEYDQLEREFSLIDPLLSMRTQAGLTQEEVAQRMHTQKGNISRLEEGNANPSWSTLQKYAHACGFGLTLRPQKLD
jgi:transcriptional regulator with XRE-family HTH domain